jgi:NAD(P)-dependent dehydrogenase (short-subunit alcohol dehydrogenase family)
MKTVLITGSTDGIGKQTALELAQMGWQVIVHGRSKIRCEQTVSYLRSLTGNTRVDFVCADLDSFSEIKKMAGEILERFGKLNVLLNNAGVFETEQIILPNGFEKTFMVNYLAHFALTLQLLNLLKTADEGRIVHVSSMAQAGTIDFDNLNGEKHYDGYNAYAVSKLENVLFAYKLARMLKDTGLTSNCLHPGVISTKLLHAGWGMGGASTEEGAQTSVFVADSPKVKGVSGMYFVHAKESRSSALSYDKKVQDRLWEISLKLTGLEDPLL